jgi:hypothetical protein
LLHAEIDLSASYSVASWLSTGGEQGMRHEVQALIAARLEPNLRIGRQHTVMWKSLAATSAFMGLMRSVGGRWPFSEYARDPPGIGNR